MPHISSSCFMFLSLEFIKIFQFSSKSVLTFRFLFSFRLWLLSSGFPILAFIYLFNYRKCLLVISLDQISCDACSSSRFFCLRTKCQRVIIELWYVALGCGLLRRKKSGCLRYIFGERRKSELDFLCTSWQIMTFHAVCVGVCVCVLLWVSVCAKLCIETLIMWCAVFNSLIIINICWLINCVISAGGLTVKTPF